MRTAPAFHTIGAPPVVAPTKEEEEENSDDPDDYDNDYASDEDSDGDDDKPSIRHVETVPLLLARPLAKRTKEDARLKIYRTQLENGLRNADGERLSPKVVVVRFERYGR